MISQRIRDALASVKARGVRLGGHRANSDQTRTEAIERAEALRGVFEKLASLSARAAAEERTDGASRLCGAANGRRCRVIHVRQRLERSSPAAYGALTH